MGSGPALSTAQAQRSVLRDPLPSLGPGENSHRGVAYFPVHRTWFPVSLQKDGERVKAG